MVMIKMLATFFTEYHMQRNTPCGKKTQTKLNIKSIKYFLHDNGMNGEQISLPLFTWFAYHNAPHNTETIV